MEINKIQYNMKNKNYVLIVFTLILFVSVGIYLSVQFVFGSKRLNMFSDIDEEIGKIKYVDINGNEVFASSNAVVFSSPVNFYDIDIRQNTAYIKAFEGGLLYAPAYGVVVKAENNVIEIEHGNSTKSKIVGALGFGVKVGDLVFAGQTIGLASNDVEFSVLVSDLPMDMEWMISNF